MGEPAPGGQTVEMPSPYDSAASDIPVVSVVIPVLNAAPVISGCLDALASQKGAPAFEVIVVDNGSRDDSSKISQRHPVCARVLVETARGPYAARNAGIAAARGRIVAFTDADCIPHTHWLERSVAAIEAGADVVGGGITQRPSPSPTLWERYDAAIYLTQDLYVIEQGFAATANLIARAKVFDTIGGFVPSLKASGDVEFCRRATAAGFRLNYVPEAAVEHHPRRTLRDTWRLHRKLGSGFAELARYGLRGSARHDRALRISLHWIASRTTLHGDRIRARRLAFVHLVAMTARWVGRLTGRG